MVSCHDLTSDSKSPGTAGPPNEYAAKRYWAISECSTSAAVRSRKIIVVTAIELRGNPDLISVGPPTIDEAGSQVRPRTVRRHEIVQRAYVGPLHTRRGEGGRLRQHRIEVAADARTHG